MAKATTVLRNLFVAFNVLFMITGAVLIVLAVVLDFAYSADRYTGLIALYVVGGITFFTAFLGVQGAARSMKWLLVIFAVLMCVDCLALLRVAVPLAVLQPRVGLLKEEMESIVPLDKKSEDIQNVMNEIQSQLQCCGLVNGYTDWSGRVPASCDCTGEELSFKVCTPLPPPGVHGNWPFYRKQPRMVRIEPCGQKIVNNFLGVLLGILFGFSALALLGMVMSGCLIAQLNNAKAVTKQEPSKIFSISAHPPKYSKLYEYE
ncbi:tetraspanin-8-like [Engraulis encrasicolus]|uniref:tetraspanin-8-like n=1 Tax=Engraulis encrasicolus TaxID=184585 RepID=UPI002FD4C107